MTKYFIRNVLNTDLLKEEGNKNWRNLLARLG